MPVWVIIKVFALILLVVYSSHQHRPAVDKVAAVVLIHFKDFTRLYVEERIVTLLQVALLLQ